MDRLSLLKENLTLRNLVARGMAITALASLGGCSGSGEALDTTPQNPAAVAEQTAVEIVAEYQEDPGRLLEDPSIEAISIAEGGSISSATIAHMHEVADSEGWSTQQTDLNRGVIMEAAAEIKTDGIPQPGDIVYIVSHDTNGDGQVEIVPVGTSPAPEPTSVD